MIKIVKTEIRKGVFVDCLEYILHAFKTRKGTFTLVGSDNEWNDEFKNLDTLEYHTWQRSLIKDWLDKGLITPVEESNSLDWHQK